MHIYLQIPKRTFRRKKEREEGHIGAILLSQAQTMLEIEEKKGSSWRWSCQFGETVPALVTRTSS
jgi:hypothetical protein